jgi:DNA-binding CsgD family transcriptional regulator
MQTIKIAILSNSFVLNRGLHIIFTKIRGIIVVEISDNLDNLLPQIKDKQIDFLLTTNDFFNNNNDLKNLYKTNKHLRWAIIETSGIKLNSLYNFEFNLSINDSESVLLKKINEFIEKENKEELNIGTESELSNREKDILREVALGFTNFQIAEKLFISQHTVITHRKKITAKLGIKTISGLTVYAILNNIIEMGDVDELI